MVAQALIQQFTINFPGQNNIVPRFGHMYAPEQTLAQVKAAGYLDAWIVAQNQSILETDIIGCVCSDGTDWLKPVFTNGSCQLTVLP